MNFLESKHGEIRQVETISKHGEILKVIKGLCTNVGDTVPYNIYN